MDLASLALSFYLIDYCQVRIIPGSVCLCRIHRNLIHRNLGSNEFHQGLSKSG